MLSKIIKTFKAFNRNRIQVRRNAKFQSVLNNNFDRSNLSIEALTELLHSNNSTLPETTNLEKFAVYSVYFGKTATKTIRNKKTNTKYKHFFISNNKEILHTAQSNGWHPIFVNLPVSKNRLVSAQQAKIVKAMPHLLPILNHFEFLFYIDDKVDFNVEKIFAFISSLTINNNSIIIRNHPSKANNILSEFAEAMIQPRYQAQRDQTISYITNKIKSGYSLRTENLYWTSAILRNMSHPDTRKINEDWYSNILECGIECQISFDFIAQNYNTIGIMPFEIN
jgi:hypothetical protein